MTFREQKSSRNTWPLSRVGWTGTAPMRALMCTEMIDRSGADALTRLLCEWTPRTEVLSSVATLTLKRCQDGSDAQGTQTQHFPTAPKQSRRRRIFTLVDHAFEAEVAWSLWRLSITYGFDDTRSKRRALRHAAIAGWICGTCTDGGVPDGFSRSCQLELAFERGRAIYAVDEKRQSTNEEGASE
ncbi:hypothetical protein AWB82_01815 [Caballeronia glebae]|uniref:Uncharacterized protein n=1 Tax=Caballeronia glebae TaxID=1777143 RepID=A0A158A6K2_9BURK|nr:hypothetical protein AWB82_01815 [Caballeronia glebae]